MVLHYSRRDPLTASPPPLGQHCLLELYGCPAERLNDVTLIRRSLEVAAHKANSTLLNDVYYRFEPQGVTALALLAESHISIHTWPERGYAAVDVFTCGDRTTPRQACHYLVEALQAEQHSLQVVVRGILAHSEPIGPQPRGPQLSPMTPKPCRES